MCSTAPLLRENLYQEKSFTDTKQVYTKCEYFPGNIPCRNEIKGLIPEVVMMHLELCDSIISNNGLLVRAITDNLFYTDLIGTMIEIN